MPNNLDALPHDCVLRITIDRGLRVHVQTVLGNGSANSNVNDISQDWKGAYGLFKSKELDLWRGPGPTAREARFWP